VSGHPQGRDERRWREQKARMLRNARKYQEAARKGGLTHCTAWASTGVTVAACS
jgi:hypothetical protein